MWERKLSMLNLRLHVAITIVKWWSVLDWFTNVQLAYEAVLAQGYKYRNDCEDWTQHLMAYESISLTITPRYGVFLFTFLCSFVLHGRHAYIDAHISMYWFDGLGYSKSLSVFFSFVFHSVRRHLAQANIDWSKLWMLINISRLSRFAFRSS